MLLQVRTTKTQYIYIYTHMQEGMCVVEWSNCWEEEGKQEHSEKSDDFKNQFFPDQGACASGLWGVKDLLST